MKAADLSQEELRICALLYSTPNSMVFPIEIVLEKTFGMPPIAGTKLLPGSDKTLEGEWQKRPYFTAIQETIQSLIDKGLLVIQEEYKQYESNFYALDIREEYKDFFKELKTQIALGSILM